MGFRALESWYFCKEEGLITFHTKWICNQRELNKEEKVKI